MPARGERTDQTLEIQFCTAGGGELSADERELHSPIFFQAGGKAIQFADGSQILQ